MSSPRRPASPYRPRPARPPTRDRSASRRPDDGSAWLWLAPPPRAQHLSAWALLPLRAFLGVTFCFAGLQKLANPAFFRSSSPSSIQAQLTAAAHRSPIHGLIGPMVHVAVPLGLLIALGELAIGLGTLFGLFSRAAAVGGLALSLGLFLTVSFHTNPYYTGSDIVFAFAWLPLLVAGSGALSADAILANLARREGGVQPESIVPLPFSRVREVCGAFDAGACTARRGNPCEPGPCPYLKAQPTAVSRRRTAELDRRTVVMRGGLAAGLGGLAVVSAGLVAGLGRLFGGSSSSPTAHSLTSGTGGTTPTSAAGTSTTAPAGPTSGASSSTSVAASRPPGTRLGPASSVPVGGSASFQDPASGDPALVIQPKSGTFLAFDAVCPHAGCSVEYSTAEHVFVCPCHGSQFNGRSGAVEVGPSQSGLTPIAVAEGSDGQLYAR